MPHFEVPHEVDKTLNKCEHVTWNLETVATDSLDELHTRVLTAKHVNLHSSFEPLCCRLEDYWFGCKNFC
jgi:hypothetical protein